MGCLTKTILLLAIFGGFIYFMGTSEQNREKAVQEELQPYNDQISRYMTKKVISDKKTPARGNIIFVDEKTKKVNKFSDYTLSPYNTPKSPSEVDSVVLHNCNYVEVGMYSGGSRALQQVCKFTVIDVASGTWSSWGEFSGDMPQKEIKRKIGQKIDEKGSPAMYSFFNAGGIDNKLKP